MALLLEARSWGLRVQQPAGVRSGDGGQAVRFCLPLQERARGDSSLVLQFNINVSFQLFLCQVMFTVFTFLWRSQQPELPLGAPERGRAHKLGGKRHSVLRNLHSCGRLCAQASSTLHYQSSKNKDQMTWITLVQPHTLITFSVLVFI